MYSTRHCGDCIMARATLEAAGVDYDEIDIDSDPGAAETVIAINGGFRSVPTIVLPSGQVLVEPSRAALLSALGPQPAS